MDNCKEYILSGTADQIVNRLVDDFGLQQDFSRFFVWISKEIDGDWEATDRNELNLWYLNYQIPSATPVFSTPFSISITELKKETAQALFAAFGNFLITKDMYSSGFQLVWTFLGALWKSTKKIDRKNLCIYYRIVDVLKSTRNSSFGMYDIIPYDEVDYRYGGNECNRHPDSWECPHWNNDVCQLNVSEIHDILDELVEAGVLFVNQDEEKWYVVR